MHTAGLGTGKEPASGTGNGGITGRDASASGTDGNDGTTGRAALDASDSAADIPGTGGAATDGVPRETSTFEGELAA